MDDPFAKIYGLTDAELEARISDLTSKYWKTSNPHLQQQIATQLEAHQFESRDRQGKKWAEAQKNLDNGLDSLINVS
jgi:hypothetical protein